MDQAAQEATQYQLKLSAEGEEGAFEELAAGGMTVTRLTDEEREAFKVTTTDVYDWFRQQGTEPNLDTYMEKIQVCNDKFTNGELEAITGVEK